MAAKKHQELPQIAMNAVSVERWNEMDRYGRRAQRDTAERVANSIPANAIKWWAIRQMAVFGRTFEYSDVTVSFARRVAVNAMTGCYDLGDIIA